MYNLFFILAISTVFSQLAHNYFVFLSFSYLKGSLRAIQAIIFCGIISVSIVAFVAIGNEKLALLGAFIEIVINFLYYGQEFWANGFPQRKFMTKSILSYWRQNWGKYFFGLLLPMLIYVFAKQMIELK